MNTSIQTKLLTMCIVLVLLTTVGISVTYYLLIRQDKQREFQQRIQIAFDIILDDLEARLTNSTNRVRDFLLDETLAIASSRYAEDEERLQSISFISTNLAKAASEIKRFGHVNSARRMMLYGANKRLLAAYQRTEEQETTGIYGVLQEGGDAYLTFNDPSELTAMLLGRTAIPETSLPVGIPAYYEEEIPEAISADLFTQDKKLGIRVIAPIFHQENMTGVLIVDLCYTQDIIERYATLSQTDVNLFSGTQFSVGTLPLQSTLAGEHLLPCHDLLNRETVIEILPIAFDKNDYYQGQCVLKNEQGAIGAISISLSQEIEKQAIRKVLTAGLSISGIVFGITFGLSWIFSRKTVRPITMIASLIHQISDGDLTGVFEERSHNELNISEDNISGDKKAHTHGLPKKNHRGHDEIALLTHSFYAMAEYLQSMAIIASKISQGEIMQTVTPRSDRDTLGIAFQHMLSYIRNVTAVTKTIADGDLLVEVQPRSERDELNHSLRKMIVYIQGVAGVAETIAEGNLHVQVQPKTDLDVLNQSLRKMVGYIQEVANITERVSNNDLQVVVMPKSEHDTLNMSLQRMIINLQVAREKAERSIAEVERQNWLKTGQAELSNLMRGEQDVAMLAKHVITYLAEYLHAQVGLMYVAENTDGEPILQLAGSYAYTTRKGNRNEFKFGEGLVGQAALEQESLLFADVPERGMRISSGLAEIVPQNILVTPFMYEGEVKGVIELGTMHTFSELHQEFLDQACENIAISLHTVQSRVRMQHLLEETQRQSETLQVQQEELRQSNAELEARTKALQESETKLQVQQEELRQSNTQLKAQAEALKASEEKLQVQQEELRQTNEELESQTRALEKQQKVLKDKNIALEESRQLIEEKMRELELTNRYKSEFLANMSHELRTPLNSILILSKILCENKEGNLTEKQLKSTHMIYKAVSGWIDLIDDLLDLSEIETNKVALNIQEMTFSEFSDSLKQDFQGMAEEKGLSFKVEVADDVPATFHTDRKRVEQIVKNLLSNAIKFTEEGEVTVYIARSTAGTDLSQSGLSPQQMIAIAVSDTGIGIPRDKQRVIFEAFQQIDGTTTRKYGGTGLGLSISQKLATLLGGEIHVQSEAGKGSTFTLYLPERIEQKADDEKQASESERQKAEGKRQEIKDEKQETERLGKILVVEDNELMRANILELLSRENIVVTTAATGQEAYAHLKAEAFDCMVLDLGLADISGATLLEHMEEDDAIAPIPVIVHTGKELSKEEELKLNAYAESIILKGVRAQERLVDEVKLFLHRKKKALPEDRQKEPSVPREEEAVLRGKKILVVDDDVRNLYALTNALEEHGMTVLMGINGKVALDVLNEHPDIDLVLMDIMMPEMDGYEAMQEIRNSKSEIRNIPIIALTAKAMKGEREKCRETGANEYLSKPVEVDKLLSLLQVWFTK